MQQHLTFLLLFLFSLNSGLLLAQADNRIAPTTIPLDEVERYRAPVQDNEALMSAELQRRSPGIAPRFAENLSVHISPDTHGTWEKLNNGNSVWRLKIYSRDAKSLNLGFTKYKMPQGGSLILYAPDFSEIRGPFTPADNEVHEQLWTPILFGEELVIEVQVPHNQRKNLELLLSYVNHDFMGFGQMAETYRSGSCNLDVLCTAADGWGIVDGYRDIIRSVAVMSTGGGTFCTGFLINNAQQDCTPYFMTAFHCGINAGNAASLITYWNFENSTCRQPGSAESGQAGDGTLTEFNTGSIFRAGWSDTDFTLVELDDPVLPTANCFMAGWTNDLNTLPTSAIAVHHPSTDEKRISFEDDAPYIGDWGSGGTTVPTGDHMIIADWDTGTTEPGSSGSPLFDQNKRVIGQLHGGAAACGNDSYDSYGWLAVSWTGNGTSDTRLSDWLDPAGTGVSAVDGADVPCAPPHCFNGVLDADETEIDCGGADCPACPTCSDGIQNQGELGVDCEGPCAAICPTCSDGILNQEETEIDCGGPNCTACPCLDNALTFTIVLDDYPEETTWNVTDDNFNVILTSNGTYSGFADGETVVEEICVTDGCYHFILDDSFGDGICCGYGTGSYELTFDGQILASGGEFLTADTTAFCITPSNCNPSYNITGTILPNTYTASNYVASNGIVQSPDNVTFQAGNYIDLNPDFEVVLGAEFLAEIVACNNGTEEEFEFRTTMTSSRSSILPNQTIRTSSVQFYKNPKAPNAIHYHFKNKKDAVYSIFVANESGKKIQPLINNQYFAKGKVSLSEITNLPKGNYQLLILEGVTTVEQALFEL